MIKAILVDDEVHCLDTLSILLDEYCPQVSIAQRCSSAKEALLAIDQHQMLAPAEGDFSHPHRKQVEAERLNAHFGGGCG